jgi:hypothetical protein
MTIKVERTFTESRFSNNMTIRDSTRFESILVKSSITLWIMSARINSTIFADSGEIILGRHALLWE